jgi:hypothetical protein
MYYISDITIQTNKRTVLLLWAFVVWIVITESADVFRHRTILYFLRFIHDIFQITENMMGMHLTHRRTTGEEVPIAPTKYITKSTDRLLIS